MAAQNINRVILTGNLTRDPELKTLPSGSKVCQFRIAVNKRKKNPSTGEWGDKTSFFNVVVWGPQGENAARFLAKGRAVAVDGELSWREAETQAGRREFIEVVADTVQFLSSPNGGGGGPAASQPADEQMVGAGQGGDDDIPF